MPIPTEPIGSIPRSPELIAGMQQFAIGRISPDQLPRLTVGPSRYQTYADAYLATARAHAHVPVKQAVITASALSLLYPQDGIRGYPREAFLRDLVREAETDIRRCLADGAPI